MAELNEFMTRIDLSVLKDYVAANGKSVVYARGERIVQQGQLGSVSLSVSEASLLKPVDLR